MKTLLLSFGILVSAIGCWETEVITCFPVECGIPATVRYLGDKDRCDYGFELADGTIFVPERRVYITAPSKEEDPIYHYQFVVGAKVKIGYRLSPESSTTCSSGKVVFIQCLTEISTPSL